MVSGFAVGVGSTSPGYRARVAALLVDARLVVWTVGIRPAANCAKNDGLTIE